MAFNLPGENLGLLCCFQSWRSRAGQHHGKPVHRQHQKRVSQHHTLLWEYTVVNLCCAGGLVWSIRVGESTSCLPTSSFGFQLFRFGWGAGICPAEALPCWGRCWTRRRWDPMLFPCLAFLYFSLQKPTILPGTFPTQLNPPRSLSHARPIPCGSSPLLWHFARKQEARYHLGDGREGELSPYQAPPCSNNVPHW